MQRASCPEQGQIGKHFWEQATTIPGLVQEKWAVIGRWLCPGPRKKKSDPGIEHRAVTVLLPWNYMLMQKTIIKSWHSKKSLSLGEIAAYIRWLVPLKFTHSNSQRTFIYYTCTQIWLTIPELKCSNYLVFLIMKKWLFSGQKQTCLFQRTQYRFF